MQRIIWPPPPQATSRTPPNIQQTCPRVPCRMGVMGAFVDMTNWRNIIEWVCVAHFTLLPRREPSRPLTAGTTVGDGE